MKTIMKLTAAAIALLGLAACDILLSPPINAIEQDRSQGQPVASDPGEDEEWGTDDDTDFVTNND